MKTRKPKTRSIKDCDISEIENPMNLFIYAVHVLKGRLPDHQHDLMKKWKEEKVNEGYVKGYFDFLNSKKTFVSKIKTFFGFGT